MTRCGGQVAHARLALTSLFSTSLIIVATFTKIEDLTLLSLLLELFNLPLEDLFLLLEIAILIPPILNSTLSLRRVIIIKNLLKSVSTFYSKKNRKEDLLEYLETINFIIKDKYNNNSKRLTIKRIVFRARLRDKAID